jgi:hypothetical protein
MSDPLLRAAERRAAARRAALIRQIIDAAPPDVHVAPGAAGLILSGRGLRARWVRDARLRSFWR